MKLLGNKEAIVIPEMNDDAKFVDEFAKSLGKQLPKGWSAIVARRFVVVQRDKKRWFSQTLDFVCGWRAGPGKTVKPGYPTRPRVLCWAVPWLLLER